MKKGPDGSLFLRGRVDQYCPNWLLPLRKLRASSAENLFGKLL